MKPFYMRANTNFGDHLNEWLWPRLIPELLAREDDVRLIGIGSLLKADVQRIAGRKVVFGSGSGYGPPPPAEAMADWRFYAVRGPLTAHYYGLEPSLAITDGAWLIDLLPEWRAPREKTGAPVFVPHWTSAIYGDWRAPAEMAGMTYVNPLDDGPSVLERIASARLVVTESLHGAIFADYFRTPWVPVSSAGRILAFKWVDWCMSVDLDYESYELPPSDWVDFLFQGQRPTRGLAPIASRRWNAEEFNVIPSRQANLRASPLYRAKVVAKDWGRQARDAGIEWLRGRRDNALMRRWNAARREELAGRLSALAALGGTLSADAARERRLSQLAEALERMRAEEG